MTTESADGEELRAQVTSFLERNFPQIWMHGGTAAIEELDQDTGEVQLRLGGACSGCGISPMTVQAIKSRMVSEIPGINTVHAKASGSAGAGTATPPGTEHGNNPSRGQSDDPDGSSDVPF